MESDSGKACPASPPQGPPGSWLMSVALLLMGALGGIVCAASSVSATALALCTLPFLLVMVLVAGILLKTSFRRWRCLAGRLACLVVALGLLAAGGLWAAGRTHRRVESLVLTASHALVSGRVPSASLPLIDRSQNALGQLEVPADAVTAVRLRHWMMGVTVEMALRDGRTILLDWSSLGAEQPVLNSVRVEATSSNAH